MLGQHLGAAAQQVVEVRVLEELVLRLGEDEGDRAGALGDQAAGVLVDHVPGLADRPLDRRERLL
nr:hypothetical protein GCM10020092_061190 [Actinoplanes digitatis]